MKKSLVVFTPVLVLSLSMVGTAQAITNGRPDGNAHPYVGLLLFTDGTSYWRCTGSLLAPQVVLTAGHCTDGAIHAWADFDTHVDRGTLPIAQRLASGIFISGEAHTAPGFCLCCTNGLVGFDTHDVGVVTLDKASTVTQFAAHPTAGFVDTLTMDTTVGLVGCGVQIRLKAKVAPALVIQAEPISWVAQIRSSP